MGGGGVEPGARVGRLGRMFAVEVQEDFLGHVFRFLPVGEHAVGDADDAGVFGQEEGLEGGRAPPRLRLGHRQSAFGVHDMLGNGWEWTSTEFSGLTRE